MTDLLTRLKEATGPDRYADCHIWVAAQGGDARMRVCDIPAKEFIWERGSDGFWLRSIRRLQDTPRYTSSIDASLALVERMLPGAKVGLYINNLTSHPKEEGARAFIRRGKGPKCPHTGIRWPRMAGECFYAPTAPLAILQSLFLALQETDQ